MTGGFFEKLDEMKSVLASSRPVEDKLAQVQPILRDDDLQREFWNLLDDVEWIPVLKRAGLFDTPPKPESIDGGIRFHPWGASKFLARLASRSPSNVSAVFSTLNTENVSVVGDMLDAAAAMPIREAAALVPAVRHAAAAGILWVHFKDASDFCARLAEEGEVDLSLSLAEALFSPKDDNPESGPGRSDSYWYTEGLKKVTPILSARRAHAFLPMLCDWLEALTRSTKSVDEESGDDYSYIWRPAIEEHEQNHDYDHVGAVVGCVREGFDLAIREGRISLSATLELLGKRRLIIFRRLSLHLLAEFGDQELNLVSQALLSRDLFDDHRLKHEYAALVAHQLPSIDAKDRDIWYRWVEDGPDMSDFDENVRLNLHREPTDEDRRSRIDYWKFQKFHWSRESLEGPRREFYERMLAQHGVPELADLNIRISSGWGEQSPTTVEQLMALTFEEAVERVSSWKPADALGPSLGGLLSTFSEYVARNAEEFSQKARSIQERPSSLVSAYLRQMTVAIKAGRAVDLPAVVDLCRWVLGQSNDGGWQSTRDEISELVEIACASTHETNRPRFGLEQFRQPFWGLVRELYRDPSESYIVRDTSSNDPRLHDYLDLGMNSPRGKAVEAGLEFARWVAVHLTAGTDNQDAVPGGMAAVPELEELINWQLEPQHQSLEAMAILGSRIGVVNWIDAQWLVDNADRLFELERIEENPASAVSWAAWNSFLVWVRPHIVFYRAFENQFRYAVRQAAHVEIDKRDHDQPMFKLGEHLMVLYGRGQVPLTSVTLQEFVGAAKPAIRRHAVGFVGSTFGHEDIPSEIVRRFMILWDAYWANHGRTDAADDPGAVLFGSWFASGVFPDDWALSCLHDFVSVVPLPEPNQLVMQQLAKIANSDILKSIQIVERMLTADREGWRIHVWRKQVRAILEAAARAEGAAREHAKYVIDFLGRRGDTTLGTLLEN